MAIKNLNKLLSDLNPELLDDDYVFCSVQELPLDIEVLSIFQEEEGLSLICTRHQAELFKLAFEGHFRCITLNVLSSLEAVGLTAAVSEVLTKANISANVVAAYHHDHVFVPSKDALKALEAIHELSKSSR